MIEELATVVLTRDVPEHGLAEGDIGTVVFRYPEGDLVEIVEIVDHPWFLGCQFHPEFRSRPMAPHPLFESFVGACLRQSAEKAA